jgi:hypothetical protein
MDSFKYRDYKDWLDENDVIFSADEIDSERYKHDINLVTLRVEIVDHPEISGFWEFTAMQSYNEGLDKYSVSDFKRVLPANFEDIKTATIKLESVNKKSRHVMGRAFHWLTNKRHGHAPVAPLLSYAYDTQQKCFFLTDAERHVMRISEADISEAYIQSMKEEGDQCNT